MKLAKTLFVTLLIFTVEVLYSQNKYELYEESYYKNGLWSNWLPMSPIIELYADFENGNADLYLSSFLNHPSEYSIKIEMKNSDLIQTKKNSFECNNAKLFHYTIGNLKRATDFRTGGRPQSFNAKVTIDKNPLGSTVNVFYNNVAYAFTTSLRIKNKKK